MISAVYAPGSWVAIAAGDAFLLLDVPPDHELVGRCWTLLTGGSGVDDVLDALVGGGIRTAPAFALARASIDERRAVVRGSGRVVLADGRELVAPEGRSWADDAIPEGMSFSVRSHEQPGGHFLPMGSGVTLAGSVAVSVGSTAPSSETPSTLESPPTEVPVEPVEVPVQPAEASEPPVVATQLADPEPEGQLPSDPNPSYDFIFEATQRPEPRVIVSDDADSTEPEAGSSPPEPVTREETASWSTQSVAETPNPGLIDALPWEQPAPAEKASDDVPIERTVDVPAAMNESPDAGAASSEAPDSIARTVDRASLAQALAADFTGPTVLAGYCPARHLTPPNAPACRVCGQPVPAQESFEIARPTLGVLTLSTGDTVVLDRAVLLGRSPEIAPDVAERPNVVRLASPENDISRSHAEVTIDGWYVYVTDLGSTNGTVVTLPGQQPRRIRAHDPQLLENGAHVNLADEVSFVFGVTG